MPQLMVRNCGHLLMLNETYYCINCDKMFRDTFTEIKFGGTKTKYRGGDDDD